MSKPDYPEEHKQHLCYLVARRGILMEENLTTITKLVSEANFICTTCGRAAKAAESLCYPLKL